MSPVFRYVTEHSSEFLALFPHRFDYLWAEHSTPGAIPEWQTESRHPLADRMIQQGAFLFGVRFGSETRYALLDIDSSSPYHPRHDRQALTRIMAALEPIGIAAHLACTSSYSGGLHLYLPLSEAVPTWKLAMAIAHLLTASGFTVEPGILECYPNNRNFNAEEMTLYKGHRLPLQQGSYLIGPEGEQVYTTEQAFLQRWEWCTSKNDIHRAALEKALKAARAKQHRISHKASKFLKDLDTDIEPGWTAHGQTNYLLGRIALRSYVFGHLLTNSEALEGERLVMEIVSIATQLPGYKTWCRHQHEIWKRAEEWARCVEASRYWHYKLLPKSNSSNAQQEAVSDEAATPGAPGGSSPNTWNTWQQQEARDRLRYAIANLLDQGALPAGARERFLILTTRYHLGGETLYRNRDLWHPDHLWKSPPDPPNTSELLSSDCAEGASERQGRSSLLVNTEGNASQGARYRQFLGQIHAIAGGNSSPDKAFSVFDREREGNDE